MTLSVVILQSGLSPLTETALASVLESDLPADEIVVVDNGSPPEDRRLRLPGQARWVLLPENTGYVRGTNAGWQAAVGDYIALCNNDIALARSCLGRLARALDQQPRLAWVSACYQAGGLGRAVTPFPDRIARELDESAGRERGNLNAWAHSLGDAPLDRVRATEATVVLVRKRASDDVGTFWNRLVYYHTQDYALRLEAQDWQSAYCRTAVFWHSTHHPTIRRATGGAPEFQTARAESERLMDEAWGKAWREIELK